MIVEYNKKTKQPKMPGEIPDDAVCNSCKELIGQRHAVCVFDVDKAKKTGFANLIWFHKDCVDGSLRQMYYEAGGRKSFMQ